MTKRKFKIETSRGRVVLTKAGKARLEWNTGFGPMWEGKYTKSQAFVDSEVLRRSDPYIPLLTGTLRNTGILGSEIGSGLVQWIAPYAAKQYYSPRKPGSMTGPLRGPFWFERMKAQWKAVIVAGARKIAGKG